MFKVQSDIYFNLQLFELSRSANVKTGLVNDSLLVFTPLYHPHRHTSSYALFSTGFCNGFFHNVYTLFRVKVRAFVWLHTHTSVSLMFQCPAAVFALAALVKSLSPHLMIIFSFKTDTSYVRQLCLLSRLWLFLRKCLLLFFELDVRAKLCVLKIIVFKKSNLPKLYSLSTISKCSC